jgi:hypothetical protein
MFSAVACSDTDNKRLRAFPFKNPLIACKTDEPVYLTFRKTHFTSNFQTSKEVSLFSYEFQLNLIFKLQSED